MIFGQIFITAFVSIQWIIYYVYITFTSNETRTYEQYIIIMFVNAISANLYYSISVKGFYISLLISPLFRKTLVNGLIKLIPRHHRINGRLLQTSVQLVATAKNK